MRTAVGIIIFFCFVSTMIALIFLKKDDNGECKLRPRTQREKIGCLNGCIDYCHECHWMVCR